jgi:hypothetical protein
MNVRTLLLLGMTWLPTLAIAAPAEPLVVTARREPQSFDYADGLKRLDRFEQLPARERSHVRLAFYVVRRDDVPITTDPIELWLEAGGHLTALSLAPNGELSLPKLPARAARDAVVLSNQPRGSLEIVYKIDLATPYEAPLTMGWLRTAIAQARPAWKEVLPGMARMTVPKFNCAEFQTSQSLTVSAREPEAATPMWESTAKPEAPAQLPVDADLSDAAVVAYESTALHRLAACKG